MGREDTNVIYVSKDVGERLEIIMSETQMNSNQLLEHFFKLYDRNVQKIWNNDDKCVDDKKGISKKDRETNDKADSCSSLSTENSESESTDSNKKGLKLNDCEKKMSEKKQIILTLPESLLKNKVEIIVKSDEKKYGGESSVSRHTVETNRSSTGKRSQISESIDDAESSRDDCKQISVYLKSSSDKSEDNDKSLTYEENNGLQETGLDICVEDAENRNNDLQTVKTSFPLPEKNPLINKNICDLHGNTTMLHNKTKEQKCFNCKLTNQICKCDQINYDDMTSDSRKEKYQCDVCSHIDTNEKSLNNRKTTNHPQDTEEKLCFKCPETFSNPFSYMFHTKSIHGEDECHKLSDTKEQNSYLRFGNSKKTDAFKRDYNKKEKLYYCRHCEYKTDRAIHFRCHVISHLARYIYCNFCEKSFTNEWDLNTHVKIIHEQSLVRACEYCGKTYQNKKNLRSHRNQTHLKQCNIFCKICNKGFFQKGHYKGHLVSHKGIKRFKCEDCNKEFSYKTVLQRHKKTCTKNSKNSSKEPSVCHICEEKFKTIYGLKEHVEEKHGENMHYLGSEYKQRESLCYQKRSCSILLQNSNEEPNIETGKQCCKEMVDSSVESDVKAVDEGEDENVQEQPMIVSTEHLMGHVVDHEIKGEDFSDDLPFHQVSSFRSKRKGTTIEDKSMSKGDNLDIAESKEMFKDLNSVSKIKTVLSSEWPKFGSDLHLKSNDSNLMKYGYFHSKTCEHSLQCHNYSKCQKCHNCLFIFNNIKDREVIKTDKRTIKHSHGSFTNKMIYRCRFCNKAFSIRVILRRHKKYCVKLKLKKADSFKCEICRSLFCKENTLRKHYSQNHGKTLLYRCSCGFIFRWRKAFRSHQQNCLWRLKDTKTTEFSQNKVVEMDSMIKKIYEIVSHSFHGNKPETMVTPSDRISPRSETQGLDNQETEGIKTEGQQGKTVLNALPSLYTKCNTCQTTSGSSFGKNMDSVDCPHYYHSDLSNQECTVVKNNIQDSSCCHSDMAQSERSTYESKEDFKRDISVKHGTNAAKSTSGRNRVKGLGYKDQLHYKNPLENETVQSRTSFSNGTVVITLSEDTQHQDVYDKDKSPVDETERVLQNSNTGSCIDLTFSEEENSCHGSSSEGDQSHQYVSGKYNDANYKLSSECLKLLNNQCSSFVDNPLHVRMFKKRTNHYFCRFCNKYFLYKTVYQNHMKLHKNDKTVTSKHFSGGSSEQNQDFYLSNTSICKPLDKKHTCKICGDTFKGIGSLKEHTSGLHGTVDRYQCNCGRSFKWRSSLGMHKQKCKESNNAFSVNGSAKHSKNVKKVSSNLNNGLMVNMKMQMYEETRPGTILNETDNYEETLSYNELTHSSTDTFQSGHPECETTESLQSGDVTYDTRETDQSRNITYDTTGTYQSEESVYAGPDQSEHSMYFTTKTSQSGDLEYETRKNNQYENFDYNNAEMIQSEQARNMSQETEVFKIETDDNIGLKIKTENNDVNDIEYCMNPLDNQNISVVQEKESENCSSYEKAQTLEISHIVKNVSASFNMTEGRSQTDCTDYGPASEMASNISVNYEQLYYTGGQILSRSLDHTMTQNSIDQGSVITNYLDWKSLQFQPKSKTSVSPYKKKFSGYNSGMREFKCKLCGDTFTLKGSLREHELGKHGDPNRYKCICGLNFKWRSSLSLHVKKCQIALGCKTDDGLKFDYSQY